MATAGVKGLTSTTNFRADHRSVSVWDTC